MYMSLCAHAWLRSAAPCCTVKSCLQDVLFLRSLSTRPSAVAIHFHLALLQNTCGSMRLRRTAMLSHVQRHGVWSAVHVPPTLTCPGRGRGGSPGASQDPPAARHMYEHAPVVLTAAARPPVVLPAPWPLPAVPGSGFQGSTNPAGLAPLSLPTPPAAARSSKPMPAHVLMQGAPVPVAAAAACGGALPAEGSAHGSVPAEGPAVPPGAPAAPAPMTAWPQAPLATAHAEAPASHAATHAEQPFASGWPAPIVLPAPACGPPSMGSSAPPVALLVPGALPQPARAVVAGSARGIAPLSVDPPSRAAPLPQQTRFAAPAPAPAFLRLPGAPAPVIGPSLDPVVTPAIIPAGASGPLGPLGTVPGAPNPLYISPGFPAVQQGAVPEVDTASQRSEPLAGAPVPIAAGVLDRCAGQMPQAPGPAGAGSRSWLPASAYAAAPQPQGLAPGPGASLSGLAGATLVQVGGMPTGLSAGDVPAVGFPPPSAQVQSVSHPLVPDPAAPNLAALPVPPVLPAPPRHAPSDPAALPAPPVLPAPDLALWARPAVAPPVLPRPLDLPMGKKAQRRAAAAARRMAVAAGGIPSADATPQGWASPDSGPLGVAMGLPSGWGPTTLRAAGPGHGAGSLAVRGFATLATAGAPRMQAAGPPGADAAAQERSWESWLGGDALAGAAGPAMHPGSQTVAELGEPNAKRHKTARGAGRTPGMRRG